MLSQFLIPPIASLTLLSQSLVMAQLPKVAPQVPSPSGFDSSSSLKQASLRPTTYRLGPGDRLRIDVFNVPQYSGEYLIFTDGTIDLQVIGTVRMEGLTLDEAKALLSQLYAPFLQQPLVTVNLTTPRPLQIAVSGEVKRPGAYTMSAQDGSQFPQLTQALQLAGGITQTADISRVEIRRATGESATLDLWALTEGGNLTQDPVLLDGDSIFIPAATSLDSDRIRQLSETSFSPPTGAPVRVVIVGEVQRPGPYIVPIQEGSQFPRLTQALQIAGGIKQAADIGNVQIVRNGESVTLDLWALTEGGNVTQDPILLDGDSIFIPAATSLDSDRIRQLSETSFSPATGTPVRVVIVGEVQRPGPYTVPIQEGNQFPRLTQALQIAGGIKQAADIGQIQIIREATGELVTLNLWELNQAGGNLEDDPILLDGDSIFVPTAASIDLDRTRQLAATNVAPAASTPIPVVVVGEVFRPGTYTVNNETGTEPPTITRAIDLAGGITAIADVRRVELRRLTQTGLQSIEVNLWELLTSGDVSQDVILQAGDTIAIPTARELDPTEVAALASASFSPDAIQVNIVGEVRRPGIIQVSPNTPLNQALLAAGGFNPIRAKGSSVVLVRLNPNGTVSRQRIPVDFEEGIDSATNPVLRNNDVVIVSRSIVTTIADTAGEILRPVGNFFSFLNFFSVFQGSGSSNN
jgi:polysaccharide biosynthesis/export protein